MPFSKFVMFYPFYYVHLYFIFKVYKKSTHKIVLWYYLENIFKIYIDKK